jgi:probable rRNA maturation factor
VTTRLELVLDRLQRYPTGAALERLIRFASENESTVPVGDWTMTVVLTDDDEIARLHAAYFNDPTPTDVISFPSGDDLGRSGGQLGDVVISLDTAGANAEETGHSPEREVAFLTLHGLLHLCGWSDASDEDREAMLRRQQELLDAFEATHGDVW